MIIKILLAVLLFCSSVGVAYAGAIAPEKFDLNKNGMLDSPEETKEFLMAGNKELERQQKLKESIAEKNAIFKSTKYSVGLKFDDDGSVDKEKYTADVELTYWERNLFSGTCADSSNNSALCGFTATSGPSFSLERSRDFQSDEQQKVSRITLFPISVKYKFKGDATNFVESLKPFLRMGYGWSETKKDNTTEPSSRESDDEFTWEFGVEFPLEKNTKAGWGMKLSQKIVFDGFLSGKNADSLGISLTREWKAE